MAFYPKILIIGKYGFDQTSGGGVTLSNLFKGWDIEKIAVAGEGIENKNYSICKYYFDFDHNECKMKFPFQGKNRKKPAETVNLTQLDRNKPEKVISSVTNQRGILNSVAEFTGLNHYRYKLEISERFRKWFTDFSPDIIYSLLSTVELIDFMEELNVTTHVPLAVHIMDDWPTTITSGQKGLFKAFWRKKIDKKVLSLFSKARLRLCISEEMSEAYGKRYGLTFKPFHNPVDLKSWEQYSRHEYSRGNPFILLYAGRIGTGVMHSFEEVALAIHELNQSGNSIELHIQTTSGEICRHLVSKFNFIKLRDMVEYSDLPKVFSSADALLLPNDFDRHSIDFLRYSMPTKASEYMISGTPILVYSSIETAVAGNALKHGWAMVVTDHNTDKLKTAIASLYHNDQLREKLGTKASAFAREHFDSGKVKARFLNEFLSVIPEQHKHSFPAD